jgi:hypothetical protein
MRLATRFATRLATFGLLTAVLAVGSAHALDTDNRYGNSSRKQWFESLEIPDAARQRMGISYKSCCDQGDVFKTRFRVGVTGDDVWEYLDSDSSWKLVPADIILNEPGLDSEPRLFKRMATGEPLCFVKPNGGI